VSGLIRIGAFTLISGIPIATFHIMVLGFVLMGTFSIPNANTIGIDATIELNDINKQVGNRMIRIPMIFPTVRDTSITWQVYDQDGELINSDGYFIKELSKGNPLHIKKRIILDKPIRDVEEFTVKVQVDGTLSKIPFHKSLTLHFMSEDLEDGYDFKM
jgi:hypothetical protein